ncbi:peptidase M14 [Alteromonas pelagimontana]|uniref:Peptidase M14 n=1 Tax=Alteromonas pelagimontana TaxID=1858656 RepID=A0A6M4MCC7_9ALTE|nr:M14 family zinc carboxypeptidase [Alteromonas pelagimontana]QJR80468.1 peptidase M14 [Alteromonas pelagimontana]
MATHPHLPAADIAQLFDTLHFKQLAKPQLTYEDIAPVMTLLSAKPHVQFTQIGSSLNGVAIHRFTLGSGPTTILAWTQMHGDEPTATAAVLDWLQILLTQTPASLPEDWQSRVTLHIIPMLNPDGAQANTRENAQGIDINRDAVAQQSPEGKLLWEQATSLQPHIAFNLHDQNPYYAVGNTDAPATISFLAPAFHQDKHVDAPRLRAKQLIGEMHHVLKHWLPGNIARYDDTYSHRSFGDNIAGLGASTILIESGAHADDPYRQIARRMNVIALNTALQSLCSGTFSQRSLADYYAIPPNREDGLCDLKLCNVQQHQNHIAFNADITINMDRKTQIATIKAIGDQSVVKGFATLAGESLTVFPRKGFALTEPLELATDTYLSLLREGYIYFTGPAEYLTSHTDLPVWHCPSTLSLGCLKPEEPAYLLAGSHNTPKLAILNGHVIAL